MKSATERCRSRSTCAVNGRIPWDVILVKQGRTTREKSFETPFKSHFGSQVVACLRTMTVTKATARRRLSNAPSRRFPKAPIP
jgi:hypothetical protein